MRPTQPCGLGMRLPCGRDPRHCLSKDWRTTRQTDGTIEVRFTCENFDLALHASPGERMLWTVAVADAPERFRIRERGYAERLLAAANDLAEALHRAGHGHRLGRGEIAVAVLLAVRRAHDPLRAAPRASDGG